MPDTSISEKGLELIKEFEGKRLKVYKCPAGKWTIGYGHTGKDVYEGKVITEAEAERLLRQDLKTFEYAVERNVEVNLTQHQRDALISWTYNLGSGSLKNSDMLKELNQGNYGRVPDEMRRWNKLTQDGI
uniref:Lysozyme n=1 Tax=Clytia hemisphaerica TaxID=252671 RepID=A0A7M5XGT8_9CNID